MGMESDQQPEESLETLAQKLKERGIDSEKLSEFFLDYMNRSETCFNAVTEYNNSIKRLNSLGENLFEDENKLEWKGNLWVKDPDLRRYIKLVLDRDGINRGHAYDELAGPEWQSS